MKTCPRTPLASMSTTSIALLGCLLALTAFQGVTTASAAAAVTAPSPPATIKASPTPAPSSTKPAAGSTAAAKAGAAGTTAAVPATTPADSDAATAAGDAEAQAAAANVAVDLSSIPKIDVSGPVTVSGGSTSVGDISNSTKKARKSDGVAVPLTDFSPVWPTGKPNTDNQVLIDVVTDSPIATIKTNQIPFIQSLAEALSVDPRQIYWYNLTQSDLNTAFFLIDTSSPAAKQAVLASLANTDNTAKFYSNAAAYTLNILNGPEVAPQELNLGSDVISTPDNYKAYNGDTGLISNNASAAGSAATMAGEGGSVGIFTVLFSGIAATLLSAAVMI